MGQRALALLAILFASAFGLGAGLLMERSDDAQMPAETLAKARWLTKAPVGEASLYIDQQAQANGFWQHGQAEVIATLLEAPPEHLTRLMQGWVPMDDLPRELAHELLDSHPLKGITMQQAVKDPGMAQARLEWAITMRPDQGKSPSMIHQPSNPLLARLNLDPRQMTELRRQHREGSFRRTLWHEYRDVRTLAETGADYFKADFRADSTLQSAPVALVGYYDQERFGKMLAELRLSGWGVAASETADFLKLRLHKRAAALYQQTDEGKAKPWFGAEMVPIQIIREHFPAYLQTDADGKPVTDLYLQRTLKLHVKVTPEGSDWLQSLATTLDVGREKTPADR